MGKEMKKNKYLKNRQKGAGGRGGGNDLVLSSKGEEKRAECGVSYISEFFFESAILIYLMHFILLNFPLGQLLRFKDGEVPGWGGGWVSMVSLLSTENFLLTRGDRGQGGKGSGSVRGKKWF